MDYNYKAELQNGQPKLLQVYEAVVRHGPISLDHAFPLINRSRSATFRALKILEKSGWIRRTFNGHQYVATSIIDDLSASGAVSPPELDLLCSLLSNIQRQNKLQIQAGLYVTPRSFHLLECSESKTPLDQVLCPVEENISCAAFSLLPKAKKKKILADIDAKFDLIARDELRARVEEYYSSLKSRGYVLDPCGTKAYIGFKTPTGQYGALSVEIKSPQPRQRIQMHLEAILILLSKNDLSP